MKIFIAGISKTGTTGLMYLIRNSMKDSPLEIFEPKVCPPDALATDNDVLAKALISPLLDSDSFSTFDKKITIIRDPRDRLVSVLLYSQFHAPYSREKKKVAKVMDVLRHKESDPASVSIQEIMNRMVVANEDPEVTLDVFQKRLTAPVIWVTKYLKKMTGTLIYKYEDFVTEQYQSLEQYLGFPLTGEAVVPDNLKRVSRTNRSGNWRSWFTEEDVRVYKPIFSDWLKAYGYDPDDWELDTKPSIEQEHCSGYFAKLIREASGSRRRFL
ncbi:MAG: sulfotransferase family 2 domain-containing protein [Deltaproteobacteria bacterium]|nr:sulfotransferase family 2 domain-containing protein [Deltaproteobacteria bacterium]